MATAKNNQRLGLHRGSYDTLLHFLSLNSKSRSHFTWLGNHSNQRETHNLVWSTSSCSSSLKTAVNNTFSQILLIKHSRKELCVGVSYSEIQRFRTSSYSAALLI